MNKLKIKFIGGGLSLAMVIGLSVYAPINTVEAADMSGKLVVIHTNDMHGHFEKDIEEGSLGISAVAALKGYYEMLGANVLLLDAGDFSQGTNLVNYYKGLNSVYFMNVAGYDAVSLGNHEFDFGLESLKAMAEVADFPILDANVISKETGSPYLDDNEIF